MKNKKEEGPAGAAGARVSSNIPGNVNGAAGSRGGYGELPEVQVKVRQHVPNKQILIVAEGNGTLGKMRVRDSAFYRHGEMITARVQHDMWFVPVLQRNRPHIGGLIG